MSLTWLGGIALGMLGERERPSASRSAEGRDSGSGRAGPAGSVCPQSRVCRQTERARWGCRGVVLACVCVCTGVRVPVCVCAHRLGRVLPEGSTCARRRRPSRSVGLGEPACDGVSARAAGETGSGGGRPRSDSGPPDRRPPSLDHICVCPQMKADTTGSHLKELGRSRSRLARPGPALGARGPPAPVTRPAGPFCLGASLCAARPGLGSLCRPPEDPSPTFTFKNHCAVLAFHSYWCFCCCKGRGVLGFSQPLLLLEVTFLCPEMRFKCGLGGTCWTHWRRPPGLGFTTVGSAHLSQALSSAWRPADPRL